jgi:RNA polymerase sigma-70 factor (ECF subfamily)
MTFRDVTTVDARTGAALDDAADVTLRMDEDAFREFYGRTSRMLWAYLARLTGDADQAHDLLQEAYFRLLRSDTPLDGDVHRRRYLFRIATNLARDGHRRRQARPTLVAAERAPAPADPAAPDHDRRLDLDRALRRLRPRERAMLWLAYAQGATHDEIASIVGVRSGSVRVLLLRARRRLAGLLGRRGRS